jgi:hypothetical protein
MAFSLQNGIIIMGLPWQYGMYSFSKDVTPLYYFMLQYLWDIVKGVHQWNQTRDRNFFVNVGEKCA